MERAYLSLYALRRALRREPAPVNLHSPVTYNNCFATLDW